MPRLLALALLVAVAGCQSADAPDLAEAPAETPAETPAPVDVPAPPDAAVEGETVAAMAGTWRSTIDPLSTVRIEGGQIVEGYDGEDDAPRPIRAVASCDDLTDAPASPVFVIEEDDGFVRCYELEGASADRLSYTYLERGNTLTFERVAE